MITTKTPLRISLLGGGTDFPAHYEKHGGACLSTTIDKYIYVTVKRRLDNKIRLSYSKIEEVTAVERVDHDIIRACLEFAGISGGIEIGIMADITGKGSGLGSSSALTVGLLLALHSLRIGPATPSPTRLAVEANHIEIEKLGRPQGIQDALAAAYGGLNLFEFFANPNYQKEFSSEVMRRAEDEIFNYKTAQKLFSHMLLFNTGQTRQSKDVLKEQHQRTGDNAEYLNNLFELARGGAQWLEIGEINELSFLVDNGWHYKKKLSTAITNPAIDSMAELARQAGAVGLKVCGAGGGGYLLVMAPPERHANIRGALSFYKELPIAYEPDGARIITNQRGHR